MSKVFDELTNRGYIEQLTHENEIKDLLNNGKTAFYIGIDPTADSLHIGHYVSLMVANRLQKAGHKPIILIGGGTAFIGDPTDKNDMRRMMTREELNHNVEALKSQIEKLVSFEGENPAILVNNADWLYDLKFLDFARDIGSKYSVNKMLAAQCYKARLETGLTFFEMCYMLLQGYDFYYLYKNYGVKLQIGGNDQWSNIISGVDLIRKFDKDDSYGLTFKLLTNKEGKKMGKTVAGALWLNPEKTSPYDFYQYWRNIEDESIATVLKILTFLDLDEIDELTKYSDERINKAKERAAFEITKIIHGEENAIKAQEAANALFSNSDNLDNIPSVDVNFPISIVDAIIETKIAPSKSQARQLIEQGGISLNNEKISDINYIIDEKDLDKGFAILKKGKKIFYKLQKEI